MSGAPYTEWAARSLLCPALLSPQGLAQAAWLILSLLAYRLYTVVPRLVKFVDILTNWYVRMNRRRLKVRTWWWEEQSVCSLRGEMQEGKWEQPKGKIATLLTAVVEAFFFFSLYINCWLSFDRQGPISSRNHFVYFHNTIVDMSYWGESLLHVGVNWADCLEFTDIVRCSCDLAFTP